MSEECRFCDISEKKTSAEIVCENTRLVAFHHYNPQAPVHVLIAPRAHIPTVNDVAADQAPLMGEMILLARDLARRFKVEKSGYRLVLNCNADGGQHVFHAHLHLIGGRPLAWPPG